MTAAAWTGRHAYIVGGGATLDSYDPQHQLLRFDPGTERAEPVEYQGHRLPKYNPAAVWTGDELVVFGGSPRILRCDPDQNTVTRPASSLAAGVQNAVAVWDGTFASVSGGWSPRVGSSASMARYDPVNERASHQVG